MIASSADPATEFSIVTRPDGTTIGYRLVPAGAGDPVRPGILFLGGYASDMGGTKATTLDRHCRARGLGFVRFDYSGHGVSSGRLADGTIGTWRDDALAVLDGVTAGPQILVGSSMGAWIMLLVAASRPGRIAGLVGVAAAPDFTEDLIRPALDEAEHAALRRDGVVQRPSAYGPALTFGARLLDEARHHLMLRHDLPIAVPARLLHGMADPDVPWSTSRRLVERLASADVVLTLIKDGDHRLARPADLARLTAAVDELSGAG
jgi:pimeloyl-ACP methyl ester carboxylesterase